jgi:cytochrome c
MRVVHVRVVVALAVAVAALVVGAAQTAPSRPDASRFTREVLLEGLNEPMQLEFDAAGRVYWIERSNRGIRRLDERTGTVELLGTIPADTASETGVVGFLLARDFETSKHVFVHYAGPVMPREMRLSRFTLGANDQIDLSTEKIMMSWGWEPATHMGGGMVWDAQGNLYLSTGDDTGAGQYSSGLGPTGADSSRTSGNSNDYRGKILRIHPEPDGTYTIPAGNLFGSGVPQTKPEIYTMGNRNPWRLSIDSATGYLHWGEVGPDGGVDSPQGDPRGYDEFNVAQRAGNFGWPFLIGYNRAYRSFDYTTNEYGAPIDPARPVSLSPRNTGIRELPPAMPAALAYPYAISEEFPELNGGGRMALGGPVYRRGDYPAAVRPWPDYYEGKWIVGDFVRNWVMAASLSPDRTKVTAVERLVGDERFNSLMDLEFGPNGDLYLLEYGTQWSTNNLDARLSKIVFNAGNRAPYVVASADRKAGARPLVVTLSSEGTGDHDGDALRYEWLVTPPGGGPELRLEGAGPRVTLDRAGTHQVSLTVTDAAGLSSAASFPILVGNEPPQVRLEVTQGNRTFFVPGQSVSYRAVATDREDGAAAAANVVVTEEYVPSGVTAAQVAAAPDAFRPATSFRHLSALALMAKSDCRVCHQLDAKSVGPSFTDISKRYRDEPAAIGRLSAKVITGGAGVWGTVAMAAHPDFTQQEAISMVEYILSTADPSRAPQRLPAQGTYGGGAEGLAQSQQAAIAALNASVAQQMLAASNARSALTAASLALPIVETDLQAKATAVAVAEHALAVARGDLFAKLQASSTRLTNAQVATLVQTAAAAAPAGGRGGGAGGRGVGAGAGAFVLRASYEDKGANGVDPILAGDIVLLRPQQLRPETAEIRSPGITFTASRDPGFFIVRSGAYIGFTNLDLTGISRIEIAAVTQFYQWPTMQGATVEVRRDSPTGPLLGSVAIFPAPAGAGRGGGGVGAADPAMGIAVPPGTTGIHNVYFVFVNPEATPTNQLLLVNSVAFRPAAAGS